MKIDELLKIIGERFEYRDGGLYVKYRYSNMTKVGNRAGATNSDGYRRIQIREMMGEA